MSVQSAAPLHLPSTIETDVPRVSADRQAWVALAADGAAAVVAGLLALVALPAVQASRLLLMALPLLWLAALGAAGSYRPGDQRLRSQSRPVLGALGGCAALAALPALLLDHPLQQDVAGELISLLVLTGIVRLIVVIASGRREPIRVVLVGSADGMRRTQAKLDAPGQGRVRLVHTQLVSPALLPRPRRAELGDASAAAELTVLPELLNNVDLYRADAVLLCPGSGVRDEDARRLTWALADRQVELLLSTDAFGAHRSRTRGIQLDGLNAVLVSKPQLGGPAKVVKSLIERIAATVGVLVLSPLLAAIAVAIRCTSPGPALFRQARTGLDGEHFVVYKFRTMRQGSADQFLALAQQAGQDSMFFKLESDPRVTRFGAFLRKTSLDELPQLFNVVLGNMSLVGPRPLPAEVDQSGVDVFRRLRALPGITGLWQVSGRSDLKSDRAVEHDLDYVDNWRLALDVSILRRTVRAVMRSDGAY